jgi:acetyl esterase/lipase
MVGRPSAAHERGARRLADVLAGMGPRPTPATRRRTWDELLGADPLPAGIEARPTTLGGVPAEELAGGASGPTIQWLHGGGYVAGSLTTHRLFGARLARACAGRVVTVGYRLAPEHPFPAALDDALAAYRALLDAGADARRLAVGGDSAGGGLALALLLALRDAGDPLPAACTLVAPLVDMPGDGGVGATGATGATDMFVADGGMRIDAYLGGRDPRDPLVSPYYGDLAGLPPMLVQVSADEALHAQCARLAERVRAQGGDVELDEWQGLVHTWQILIPACPEAGEAIERLATFACRRAGLG